MVRRAPTIACLVIGLAMLVPAAPGAAGASFSWRVPELSGGTISDKDFKGRILVVDVWATWCGPCRMVIPHLVDLQNRFGERGVAVVGLNADAAPGQTPDVEAIRAFSREFGINYPIGLMNEAAYGEVFRVMGYGAGLSIPTTLILGRNGRIIKRYPGYFPGQEDEIGRLITRLLETESESAAGQP